MLKTALERLQWMVHNLCTLMETAVSHHAGLTTPKENISALSEYGLPVRTSGAILLSTSTSSSTSPTTDDKHQEVRSSDWQTASKVYKRWLWAK
jgi:hypothetical protein